MSKYTVLLNSQEEIAVIILVKTYKSFNKIVMEIKKYLTYSFHNIQNLNEDGFKKNYCKSKIPVTKLSLQRQINRQKYIQKDIINDIQISR